MSINIKQGIKIIENIAKAIEQNRDYLTDLDSAIGDADHGINMSKGFRAVSEKLNSQDFKNFGELFKTVGMTLISTVGGASGPLYGTAFMKAGTSAADKTDLDINDFLTILESAIEGIKLRGKAQAGDKTMLDALIPALETIKEALSQNELPENILEKACKASKDGAVYTASIAARKGRASYLGERSIGVQDPGAASSHIMLDSILQSIKSF